MEQPNGKEAEANLRGYLRQMELLEVAVQDKKEVLKRLAYYGIRYWGRNAKIPDTLPELKKLFAECDYLQHIVGYLTPRELTTIFPITKTYDGMRAGSKDYFYTMEVLQNHGMDKMMTGNVQDILFDYENSDVRRFLMRLLQIVSMIRRAEGKKGLAEEFADKHDIATFSRHEDEKGRGYLLDKKTGKTFRVREVRPTHLHLVH